MDVVAPEIELVKTVGTDPSTCATTGTLDVPIGTEVVYCFTVTNTGDITLTVHDLVDDQLGDLLVGEAFDLGIGESYFVTATAVVTVDVTNTATWTAANGEMVAEATDTATVTVYQPFYDIFLPIINKNQNW